MNTRWPSSVMRDELGDNSNTCSLFEVNIDLVKTKSLDEVIFFNGLWLCAGILGFFCIMSNAVFYYE